LEIPNLYEIHCELQMFLDKQIKSHLLFYALVYFALWSLEEYTRETYIIAVQSHDGYEVKVFNIENQYIEAKVCVIEDAIKRIAWHRDNDLWDHIKEYYEGDGAELLWLLINIQNIVYFHFLKYFMIPLQNMIWKIVNL